MTIRIRLLVAVALLTRLAVPAVATQQRAIIRYNPQAPLDAIPQSEREQTAFLTMLDEDDPVRRNRLIEDLVADFANSEYMHLFLQSRWELRLQRDDPEAIIEAALEGLDAYQYFIESKLGFIDDPTDLRDYPTAMFRFHSQELRYYQSLVQAHTDLQQPEQVAEYTELGLTAAAAADEFYAQLGTDAEDITGMDADAYAEASTNTRMFLLNNMRNLHEANGNIAGAIEVGERMLEVLPDDMELLLSVSAAMVQQVPEDPALRQDQMERALAYADRAAEGIDLFLLRADVSEEQQAGILAQLYSTMGMASAQLGDWDSAITAYEAAIDATPGAPNLHYMLGIAGANAQDIDIALPAFARAHFLAPDIAEVRTTLEQLYQAKEGSLDGLDDYVASEGASIVN